MSHLVTDKKVLLVGGGPMALEYAKVLKSLEVPFEAVTRKPESAKRFTEAMSAPARAGGVEGLTKGEFARAIVAVEVENLASVVKGLLEKDLVDILVEKPGALTVQELETLIGLSKIKKAQVHIGYNRRFYSSVLELKRRLETEPILSAHFEFTEWSHKIETYEIPEVVKKNWLLANSSHVIDLCFHLIGEPTVLHGTQAPGIAWHPAGGVFTGSGISDQRPFSYHANWMAPGRWGVEILTRKNKYVLRPLEELKIQPLGRLEAEPVAIDDRLDKEFKPGIYLQTKAFLSQDYRDLVGLPQQQQAFTNIYNQILGQSL